MLVPLGPVAVFGASNFPLAFSVPGGDTVSALAAGCPVVIKAHESHPALSLLTFEAMKDAAESVGAPHGILGLVFGQRAGADLVQNPAITAVGFTGSLSGGQALLDLIAQRRDPIPFYGELSSLNPVVLTADAVAARGEAIAAGLVASVTASGGQLCTKPGLVLVPRGEAGDSLIAEASRLIEQTPAATLLNERISTAYESIRADIEDRAGVRVVAAGGQVGEGGFSVSPRLLEMDAAALEHDTVGECFGPVTLLVRYDTPELGEALAALPASLTATVHAEDHESALVVELSDRLRSKAGRLLYNGYPTGVHVSWAQHHGGSWPSTNSQHTSVGATAVRRFQRPVTWQSAPPEVLPVELREEDAGIVRRIDGDLVVPRS
jgi:NADP-dependent aldehyde dehydrogenase